MIGMAVEEGDQTLLALRMPSRLHRVTTAPRWQQSESEVIRGVKDPLASIYE